MTSRSPDPDRLPGPRPQSEALFESVSHRLSGGWDVTTLTGIHRGQPVTACCAGIGAGQTSNVMEELINLGGRVFLQIGATGAMQETIAMGDVIIPTGSVRDEDGAGPRA